MSFIFLYILHDTILCPLFIGGEDYIEINRDVLLRIGTMRQCLGIVIIDDSQFERNETFELLVDEFGISTNATILNDDMEGVN